MLLMYLRCDVCRHATMCLTSKVSLFAARLWAPACLSQALQLRSGTRCAQQHSETSHFCLSLHFIWQYLALVSTSPACATPLLQPASYKFEAAVTVSIHSDLVPAWHLPSNL